MTGRFSLCFLHRGLEVKVNRETRKTAAMNAKNFYLKILCMKTKQA